MKIVAWHGLPRSNRISGDQLQGNPPHNNQGPSRQNAFARERRAGDGKQVRAQPRNKARAAQFRSRGVQRAVSARRHIDQSVVAGLTGINAYESTDPDNAFYDGLTSPREYFDDQ